jgi:Protein of unknown function (DUF3703)
VTTIDLRGIGDAVRRDASEEGATVAALARLALIDEIGPDLSQSPGRRRSVRGKRRLSRWSSSRRDYGILMPNQRIPSVNLFVHLFRAELDAARQARARHDAAAEFARLERAHVLAQSDPMQHVRVHAAMLLWGMRQRRVGEIFGQLVRIAGAATKTMAGLVPRGNHWWHQRERLSSHARSIRPAAHLGHRAPIVVPAPAGLPRPHEALHGTTP